MNPRALGRDGFVLIAALWLMVLVVGVSASVLLPLRTARLQARNVLAESEASRAARSGIAHGLALVEQELRRKTSRRDAVATSADRLERISASLSDLGTSQAPGRGEYRLSIEDGSARLPVNSASEGELQRLLLALGIQRLRAIELAAAISDWIDSDELHRLNGAEWDDYYADQPAQTRPANGPLADLAELRHIRGVDREVFALIEPLLTVETDHQVNLNTAPVPVLSALPGLSDEAVRTIVSLRRSGIVFRSLEDLAARLTTPSRALLEEHYSDLRRRVQFRTRAYRLTSAGRPSGQGRAITIEATVAIVGQRAAVVRTLVK